ncbi:MAG: glycosyltransferase family 4 protein [Terriglobia bacterium]
MRFVWLSQFIPYPPRGGSRQRSFNLIRHLAAEHEVCLAMLNMLGEGADALGEYKREFEKYCPKVEIWEPPYPWRGARWWAQLAVSPWAHHHYAAQALWSPELEARWENLLRANEGALVHFDSIDLARYFSAANGFRRALNHHNCESAMAARRADNESHPLKKAYLRNQAVKIARAEREWCPKVEVNLAVSALDAERLRKECPGAHFHVVENGTDSDYFFPSDAPTDPNTLIFAGGLSWYPNVSGIQFFVREIWPRVKLRLRGVRLFLAGRSPSHAVVQIAARDPDITLIADPEDIRPWIGKAAVYVCPILDGGGTRLKILDALAMGKAVVSTTVGCEGLDLKHEEHLLMANSPDAFTDSIARLFVDPNLCHRLGASGRAAVEKLYSWKVIGRHLTEAYLCASLPNRCPSEPLNPV